MLNEEQLEYLPERIAQRLEKVNQHFLEIIGERIKEIGSMSATDIHRLEQMKAVGADVDKITAELASISGKNAAEIKEIYDIVANDSVQFSEQFLGDSYIPYSKNTALKQYVAALASQSIADYASMSQNTAFMVYQNGKKVLTSLSKAYSDVIDDAITAVTTGQTDFYSATRNSLKRMADSGIRTKYSPLKGSAGKAVDYASGYSRRLDTAIRQNLLWGVKQCNQGVQEQVGESFGADGWEIDYHSNPRPSHAAMGGKQYAAGDKGKVIDGIYYPPFTEVEDLLADYGCLHRKWPIICGISEPNHSAEELAKLKAEDEKTIEFEGREYTKYELSQIQRKLETAARHAKDRQIIAKAAGDDELRRQEQAKINLITSKYAKVSRAAGLPTRAERMSVSRYRRVKTFDELEVESGPFKKIKGNHSLKKDLALINPNYVTGKDEWTLNCQRCVSAYEMRRRGFDVEAMPRILNGTDKLPIMNHPEGWPTVYKGFNLIDCSGTSGINAKIKVENLMAGWGDGARSIIRVRWKGGGGHVFNAEQINGKTVFIDAQSNETSVEYYFDHIIRNNIFCMRVDNLDVTDKIKDCCKARKG